MMAVLGADGFKFTTYLSPVWSPTPLIVPGFKSVFWVFDDINKQYKRERFLKRQLILLKNTKGR